LDAAVLGVLIKLPEWLTHTHWYLYAKLQQI
jgi:hypothetical protein